MKSLRGFHSLALFILISFSVILPITNQTHAVASTSSALLFTSTRDGNKEIYTINPDGSGLRRLTNNPADDDQARWSFDHSSIVFVSNRDGQRAVYRMNADGSGVLRLSKPPLIADSPVWSPDGKFILFTVRQGEAGLSFFQSSLYIMDADGMNARLVTGSAGLKQNGSSPAQVDQTSNSDLGAWSPDGKLLAFARHTSVDGKITIRPDLGPVWLDPGSGYFLISATDGTNLQTLSKTSISEGKLAWSPTGNRIALVVSDDGGKTWVLRIFDLDQNTKQTLELGDSLPLQIQWSPDGSRILVGLQNLWWYSADGKGSQRLVENTGVDTSNRWASLLSGQLIDRESCWSPDGKQLVYVQYENGQSHLYIMNVDGSGRTRLTQDAALESNPDW